MSGECSSCPECQAHYKLVEKVKDQLKDHDQLNTDLKEHKKDIWGAVNKLSENKLSAAMFKWIAGFLIMFCLGSGSIQVSLLDKISDLKRDIAVLQALLEKNNTSQQEVNGE